MAVTGQFHAMEELTCRLTSFLKKEILSNTFILFLRGRIITNNLTMYPKGASRSYVTLFLLRIQCLIAPIKSWSVVLSYNFSSVLRQAERIFYIMAL
jgi:hypothetical protein